MRKNRFVQIIVALLSYLAINFAQAAIEPFPVITSQNGQTEEGKIRLSMQINQTLCAGKGLLACSLKMIQGSNIPATLTISNHSTRFTATNVRAMLPADWLDVTQNASNCAVLPPQGSCTLIFVPGAIMHPPVQVAIAGNNTIMSYVIMQVDSSVATITVSPATLQFAENSTGQVTVTNSPTSTVAAANIVATIPSGSNISIQSTTCGASLAIGASCTITFASSTLEGPTNILIAGGNTNLVNVAATVTNQPQISITGPIQQGRIVTVFGITPLSLVVTNDAGSPVNANEITVSNKAACPNLAVDSSLCVSVAPGASCSLNLSSNSPYAPCTITVSGSNTANSPQALIAFRHLGGLVFQESGGTGKVVIDVAQGFISTWTNNASNIAGATSLNDGLTNTNAIVAHPDCSTTPLACAAQGCRNISSAWYLPARNELTTIRSVLCSNATTPCNFGGFSSGLYWSSSQNNATSAFIVLFPSGSFGTLTKLSSDRVRCVQTF